MRLNNTYFKITNLNAKLKLKKESQRKLLEESSYLQISQLPYRKVFLAFTKTDYDSRYFGGISHPP